MSYIIFEYFENYILYRESDIQPSLFRKLNYFFFEFLATGLKIILQFRDDSHLSIYPALSRKVLRLIPALKKMRR